MNTYTHSTATLPAQPLLLPARVSDNYQPQPSKLYPQPLKPVKTIFTNEGIVTSAENVYRRHMIDLGRDVFLMDGRQQQLVSIKAAPGELLRQPKKFIAVVMTVTGHKKDIELKCWQPLSVK